MNHDAPMTPAAMQAHIAELEQQLKLSDEGVSQLAQRCLELEQQLLACQTELAKHSAEAENITLTLPQLFYDTGSGFSPRECLTATEDVYNELTHEVSVTFVLPEDARAIRLDPGELACCITDLAISDERISFQSVNGLLLQEDRLLFLDVDPNLSLHCTTGFGAGMKFAVNYHYYPLGRFLHEQPGKSLLRALNDLKLENAAAAQEADRQRQERMQRAQADADKLLKNARGAAEQERNAMLEGAKKDIAQMVVSATGKLMDKENDPAFDKALYDSFLKAAQEENDHD